MKTVRLSLVVLSLGMVMGTIGCGPSARESTEQERAESEAKMNESMPTMSLPKNPGQGATPSGAPTATPPPQQ